MTESLLEDQKRQEIIQKIYNHPRFKETAAKKQSFSLFVLLLTLGFYILLIFFTAFAPNLVGQPITENMATTWGIPIGFFLIIWTIILTGVYVSRVNKHYDRLNRELLQEIANDKE